MVDLLDSTDDGPAPPASDLAQGIATVFDSEPVVAVDLFCGAGGFSIGLKWACQALGRPLVHAGINHWEQAIETHQRNHPHAEQYHSKIEALHPPEVVDDLVPADVRNVHTADVSVDLLTAGPECTHFSSARGGKPVSEQKRMSAWEVLDWLEKLDVQAFIIENVGEIKDWGPIEDGQPSRDGSIFEAWVNALNSLGYSVDWTTLNAKHFGDPTSRERFFLIGQQDGKATFPEPTHSDTDDSLPDPRPAADIIDWSDPGTSIWTRDLTEPRVNTPPKASTMSRIAEGLRRHCDDRLAPFAEVLETMGRDEIRHLRQHRVVPAEYAGAVAQVVDEPFLVSLPNGRTSLSMPSLVKYYGTSPPQSVDAPVDTITANGGKYALSTAEAETILLRQQDGAHPISVTDRAVPTIATGGGHAIATAEPHPLIEPKNLPFGGLYSNRLYDPTERPFHTVIADPRAKLVSPSLIRYSHGGATLALDESMPTIATERGGVFALSSPRVQPLVDDYESLPASPASPLGTITSRDKFALCVPDLGPWGLDIKYRMLQPDELKQAQGFPADYELVGIKEDRTEQIGNAVPVNLARALCEHVLAANEPSLASFGGGISEEPDAEIPDYSTVVNKVSGD